MKKQLTSAALAISLLGSGCGQSASQTIDPTQPTQPTQPTTVVAPNGLHVLYSGTYDVHSTLNFAQNNALPSGFGDIFADLKSAQSSPSATIIALATQGKASGTLKILLKLGLADALDQVLLGDGNPYATQLQQLATIGTNIGSLASSFDVHMTMIVANPDASGTTKVDEDILDVTFTVPGQDPFVAALPTETLATARASVSANIKPGASPTVADGLIKIADASFTLPFGSLILAAANKFVIAPLTGSAKLSDALSAVVNCTSLGTDVANNLNSGIPGAAAIITGVCNDAMKNAASAIEGKLTAITLQGVVTSAASAQLLDGTPADGQADSISGGQWTWNIPVDSKGTVSPVPSSFVGTRKR